MTLVKKTTCLMLLLAMALAAAPVQFSGAAVSGKAAWAKHGADDPAGHNAGDDRGRNRGAGGGGADDGANHR